jgi:hypothetical protein
MWVMQERVTAEFLLAFVSGASRNLVQGVFCCVFSR